MIRFAGVSLVSAVLVDADKSDESLGLLPSGSMPYSASAVLAGLGCMHPSVIAYRHIAACGCYDPPRQLLRFDEIRDRTF